MSRSTVDGGCRGTIARSWSLIVGTIGCLVSLQHVIVTAYRWERMGSKRCKNSRGGGNHTDARESRIHRAAKTDKCGNEHERGAKHTQYKEDDAR